MALMVFLKAGAGADIGKRENSRRCYQSDLSQIFRNLYILYGAPFEIIIASVFLYFCTSVHGFIQVHHLNLNPITGLLGFSGTLHSLDFFTLVLFTPLNQITNSGYLHCSGPAYGCSQWAVSVRQVHKVRRMGRTMDQSGGTRKGEGTQVGLGLEGRCGI